MANAFDKFDGTNAFDKFDAKKPAPESTIDNILGGAKNLAYGIAKGVADPIYGTAQLGMHGLNALSGNRLSGITNDLDAKISGIENQYQADTPGSIPAGAGRFLGNMAYPIRGGGLVKSAATGAADEPARALERLLLQTRSLCSYDGVHARQDDAQNKQ